MFKKIGHLILVLAISLCTIPFVQAQATAILQNAAVANGNGTVLSVTGTASAVLTVNCSGCGGGTTVNFEGTSDGTNYVALLGVLSGTTTTATTTTTAGVGVWTIATAGFQNVRARISGYSAGTVTITGRSVVAPPGDSGSISGSVTVSGTVTANQGTSGSSAWPVMDTSGTAITIYAGTGSTIADLTTTTGGSSPNFTANTLTINSLHCFNRTSSAATITRADASGTVFQSGFSIPANSDLYVVSPNAMEKQVGLALWSGSNNALRCVVDARQ